MLLELAVSGTSVICVRVPNGLRERMRRLDVNWSEYIRRSIAKKVDELEARAAAAQLDAIRVRAKPVSTRELVSWIREARAR